MQLAFERVALPANQVYHLGPGMPPIDMVLSTFRETVLPSAAGAALVAMLFFCLGRWASALGSAVAIICAYLFSNFTFKELSWEGTYRLMPWIPTGETPPAWQWMPLGTIILILLGLLTRWLGLIVQHYRTRQSSWFVRSLVWIPRIVGVAIIGRWLVPAQLSEHLWIWPALSSLMLLTWFVLDALARSGSGDQVAIYQSLLFLTAGGVLIHAHSSQFMEFATLIGCAMFGLAAAAYLGSQSDLSGAVPVAPAVLAPLLLSGQHLTYSKVPDASFWLVALAPVVLIPFAIPASVSRNGWMIRLARVLILLIPLAIAIALAADAESLVSDY